MTPLHGARHVIFATARLILALVLVSVFVPGQTVYATRAALGSRPPRPLHRPSGPAVDTPPVANDDNLAAFTDQDYQYLYVLDNDTDPDGDPLTITDVGPAAHGDAAMDFYGVNYKPFAGFSGTDTFTYTITDGTYFASATVTVTVAPQGTANNRFAVYAGPDDSSRWTVSPYGGTGSPSTGGDCNSSSGLSIDDVLLQNPLQHLKAFDNGLTFWVNNQQVTPRLPMIVTRHSLVSGPVVAGGVRVTVFYDGLPGSDTLRSRVVFDNVSGSTQVFTATIATNLGSDANTVLVGTSSGGGSFTTADRWLVTSDSASNPSLIVDTHVLYGPGSPAVTPGQVYNTSFACNEQPIADTHGVRADFGLSIPPGGVQQLLFFNQAHSDNLLALSDAAVFNQTPLGLLAGLSNTDLAQIVNWNIGPLSRLHLPVVQH